MYKYKTNSYCRNLKSLLVLSKFHLDPTSHLFHLRATRLAYLWGKLEAFKDRNAGEGGPAIHTTDRGSMPAPIERLIYQDGRLNDSEVQGFEGVQGDRDGVLV